MPDQKAAEFLTVIEDLSKRKDLHSGDSEGLLKEIMLRACNTLGVDRVNAWLFDEEKKVLHSVLAYDVQIGEFYKEEPLEEDSCPLYFKHLKSNEIIVSINSQHDVVNKELLNDYLIPLDIHSMIDVPIRSEGRMIGLLCFEQRRNIRGWTFPEQKFAIAITQLFTLALEAEEKRKYQEQLEKLVKEKDVLIAEINHRVKNNLAVITALIRSEKHKAKDNYHDQLFESILNKTYSLAELQNQLYSSKNYKEVDFCVFLKNLSDNLFHTYGHGKNIRLIYELAPIRMDITKAIPGALIANEILTNAYKYAFAEKENGELIVSLTKKGDQFKLLIKDNGPGIEDPKNSNGTGLELVKDLTEQLDGKTIFENKEGLQFELVFSE